MTVLPLRPDGWSVDDLDQLPDDGLRYELVDGALLVTPPPRPWHDDVAGQLLLALAPSLPRDLRATLAPGVYFDERNYRQPDLAVYRRESARQPRRFARDVVLAVEVVSPGSLSSDRVTKPAQYAAAGIPHYWRLEPEPLALFAYRLVAGRYEQVARATDVVQLEEPVAVRFRLPDLLP